MEKKKVTLEIDVEQLAFLIDWFLMGCEDGVYDDKIDQERIVYDTLEQLHELAQLFGYSDAWDLKKQINVLKEPGRWTSH